MDKKIEIKKLSHLDFDEAFSPEPSLIDKAILDAVKRFEELAFSLFEEYGYSRDEVMELGRNGYAMIDRRISIRYPEYTFSVFSVHGETLFTIVEKYDIEKCTFYLAYEKVKGEKDESADY